MSSSKLYAGLSGCVLAIAGLSGCFITTEPLPGPEPTPRPIPGVPTLTGTLTISWTVSGSHIAPACAEFGAYDLELIIVDRLHRPVRTETAACSDFTLTTRLPAGNYEAVATLVDPRSRAVSTSLPLRDIRILPNSDLAIAIEFPTTSKL